MTVVKDRFKSKLVAKYGQIAKSVGNPEDLKIIVNSRNHKQLYFALKHIDFSYNQLYKFVSKEFSSEYRNGSISKAAFLSKLMEVSESTFYRWQNNKKKVSKKNAERLTELINLYSYGEDVFESKDLFREWLHSPNLHLDQNLPVNILDSLPGIRFIKHLLDKIEYGAPI